MYSNSVICLVRWPYLRSAFNVLKCTSTSSSSVKPALVAKKLENLESKGSENIVKDNNKEALKDLDKSNLIASAFGPKTRNIKKVDTTEEAIDKATTPEQLLNLVDVCKLNRRHVLKIISILAEWSVTGGAEIKDFERDPRFTSLCRTLGRPYNPIIPKTVNSSTDDLTMVLNVKNDDEASKIVTTFTTQQIIKVLSSLAMKKRRSVPLLRSLSFCLAQNPSKLDVKQGADILYALATLNYPDEVLIEKVAADLLLSVPKCKKTSVIGSISTSLGMLRIKDISLLDCLCEWTNSNIDICRSQDLYSVLFTMAHVNHQPISCESFFQDVRKKLLESDHSNIRLEVIWALTVLGQANQQDYASVLSSEFYDRLLATHPQGLPLSSKKKLLNINGAAQLSEGYEGPLISDIEDVLLAPPMSSRSKEKQILVTSVFEALSNLLPSSIYLRTNVNLNMGFSLDGECLVDAKMTPLPLVDRKTGNLLPTPQKGIKIAIFVWDYHQHTKGNIELCGVPSLCQKLTAGLGYRILNISYMNFNPKDKLTNRVKYLEKSLKFLVNPS